MAGLPFWTVKTPFWDKTECDVIRRARICPPTKLSVLPLQQARICHFTFAASMVVK
jgi:hypothetical protein